MTLDELYRGMLLSSGHVGCGRLARELLAEAHAGAVQGVRDQPIHVASGAPAPAAVERRSGAGRARRGIRA